MKYLYLFKKQNGDMFIEGETLAYKHIFQNENYREVFTYLGRFPEDEYLTTQDILAKKMKEYRAGLIAESTELQADLKNESNVTRVSRLEDEFAKKIQDFAWKEEVERLKHFATIAKKEYMDKNMNISTPGGNRDYLISQVK